MLYFTENKYDCTGCGACSAVCPVNCISFVRDEEGFDYPIADSHCINCGNCEKVCPIVNTSDLFYLENVQKSFAGRHKNNEVWENSASGGAFTAISSAYCNSDNVIYGAKFEGAEVIHDYVTSVEDIGLFRKSKYIQSKMDNSYKEIRSQLLEGRKVLFSGTPCQIAGIRNYLKEAEINNNLLCIDLVCHGVGSPGVFDKYIDSLEKKYNSRIKSFSFRNKKQKFGRFIEYIVNVEFDNGRSIETEEDLYNAAFLQALLIRPSCLKCKFARSERVGDITIADFKRKNELLPEAKGLDNYSTIIINSAKGDELLSQLRKSMVLYNVNLLDIIRTNSPLKNPSKVHPNREDFFRSYRMGKPVELLLEKYLLKQSIKNKVWKFLPDKLRAAIKRGIK